MRETFLLLLLFVWTAESRHVEAEPGGVGLEGPGAAEDAAAAAAPAAAAGTIAATTAEPLLQLDGPKLLNRKRLARGAKDRHFGKRDPHTASSRGPPRYHHNDDPDGYFTTPAGNSSVGGGGGSPRLLNPLFPVTDGSYWAYAILLVALVMFAAGIVGNLALVCTVWHNLYLKSTWNCVLAGLAFWDFIVLFFCLPVVVFHELTSRRLLGDLSCRLVPYLEVRE